MPEIIASKQREVDTPKHLKPGGKTGLLSPCCILLVKAVIKAAQIQG